MKMIEFTLSMLVTVIAVSLGFGCALAIATVWLRSVMRAITRTSYNVSSVPDTVFGGVGINRGAASNAR